MLQLCYFYYRLFPNSSPFSVEPPLLRLGRRGALEHSHAPADHLHVASETAPAKTSQEEVPETS